MIWHFGVPGIYCDSETSTSFGVVSDLVRILPFEKTPCKIMSTEKLAHSLTP